VAGALPWTPLGGRSIWARLLPRPNTNSWLRYATILHVLQYTIWKWPRPNVPVSTQWSNWVTWFWFICKWDIASRVMYQVTPCSYTSHCSAPEACELNWKPTNQETCLATDQF